jgi:diaminopimelate decarboxylase
VRLGARRDQLHRHQCLGAGPRCPACHADPPQSRCDQPDRARRAARSRAGDRAPDQPGGRRGLPPWPRLQRRAADEVRDLRDRIPDALAAAARHGLTIDTIHFHAGSGWLGDDGLAAFESALARVARITAGLIAAGHRITEVNVGGGLGVPARSTEQPVDLDAYAAVIARQLGPLGVVVGCEPGDYIAKDAAILLGEVVSVEEHGGTGFVGLDLGWNVNCSYFIYRYAQEIVVCRAADAPRTEIVTVAGHINEAGDVFAEDYPLQPVAEGDIVAILNAGGYHEAMSSTHCLRPLASAVFLDR